MKSNITSLLRKDRKVMRNLWRVVRRESLFKVGFVLLFAACLLCGLFALFFDGFRFLAAFGGVGFMVTRRLFSLFFLGLGAMLVISSMVTSYSTLFRSREVPLLLVSPFDDAGIVTYKFAETALLSSWAFFIIIIPFGGAYAVHEKLGFGFGLWILAFTVPFLVLCSGLGTLITLLVVRWIPRGRSIGLVLLLACGVYFYMTVIRLGHGSAFDSPVFMLARIVPGLKAASLPGMPSWWTAEGIKACSRGDWYRGLMLLGVLTSNALMAGLAVQCVGKATFYEAFQRVHGSRSRAARRTVMFRRLSRALRFLARDVRAVMLKDVRTFCRDPMQWSQALIFFGLLAFYFASIRSFRYDRLPQEWRNMIAFLNVFSVAAVQCSLASRFVYPQLSLEGQAFWMLGLSPITTRRILLTKFALAAAAMLAAGIALILLSTRMLHVEPQVRLVALAIISAISVAVSGLSTGLGAVFLDLKKANPASIVSGFGGTVNLVLSLVFMLAAIIPFGLIFHFSFLGHLTPSGVPNALAWGFGWLMLITLLTTVTPLWIGRRAMLGRDF